MKKLLLSLSALLLFGFCSSAFAQNTVSSGGDNMVDIWILDGTTVTLADSTWGVTFPVGGISSADFTISTVTPDLLYVDTDTTDEDTSGKIGVNCTDTATTTEDCDMTFTQQVAGNDVDWLVADADGNITLLPTLATTSTKAIDITIANATNDIGLTVTNNDTDNNPAAASIINTTTGDNLFVDSDGNGKSISIDSEATTSHIIDINGASAIRTSGALMNINDGNSSSTANTIEAIANSSGHFLTIDKNTLATNKRVFNADVDFSSTTAGNYGGFYIDMDKTGDVSTGTENIWGVYSTPTVTGASGGTIKTYGGYFDATGDTGGTSTAYGGYFKASGADNNFALVTDGGNVGIGTTTPYSYQLVTYKAATNYSLFATSKSGLIGVALGTDDTSALIQGIKHDASAHYYDLYLQPSGGQVGIGVQSPTKGLEVSGGTLSDDYYSGDGTQGMTGTCADGTSLTIKDGLVTSCS